MKKRLLIAQVEPPQKLEGGDYFYRAYAPGIAMAQEDEVYVINLTNDHRKKFEIMAKADILILNSVCDPDLLPVIAKRKSEGMLTVYEIGDNFDALEPWNPVYFFYENKENLGMVYRLANYCDAIQVTCRELKKCYGHLNINCEVFPNQILHVPSERPKKETPNLVLGWAGSHGHIEDIAEIAGCLSNWIMTQPDVSLYLMCSEPIWKLFDSLPQEKKKHIKPGAIEDYYDFLSEIDIGIGHMKDTPYNRSRSDVKFLEYAVSGVVPVMKRLEPYIGSVDHGKTGFLYANPEELTGILNQLVDNPARIRKITTAARKYVLRKRLQLKHGKDRTAFYRKELSGLKRDQARIGQSAESFEEWSKLEGAVRNNRHLELRPTRFENLLHDGLVASQLGKDQELAKQFFEEASAIDPDNYLSFLYGYSVLSDPVMSLRKALERNPDSLKAWILLGEELAKKGKIKEAFGCFNSAAMVCPQYEIPLLRAALLLEKLGERSQAENLYDKAAKLTINHF